MKPLTNSIILVIIVAVAITVVLLASRPRPNSRVVPKLGNIHPVFPEDGLCFAHREGYKPCDESYGKPKLIVPSNH